MLYLVLIQPPVSLQAQHGEHGWHGCWHPLPRLHGTTLHAIEASACFFQLVRRHTCAGVRSCAEVFVVASRADLVVDQVTGLLAGWAVVDLRASSRGGEHHVTTPRRDPSRTWFWHRAPSVQTGISCVSYAKSIFGMAIAQTCTTHRSSGGVVNNINRVL